MSSQFKQCTYSYVCLQRCYLEMLHLSAVEEVRSNLCQVRDTPQLVYQTNTTLETKRTNGGAYTRGHTASLTQHLHPWQFPTRSLHIAILSITTLFGNKIAQANSAEGEFCQNNKLSICTFNIIGYCTSALFSRVVQWINMFGHVVKSQGKAV